MLIFNFSSNPWSLEYLKFFAINIPPWFCGKPHTQAFWPSPTFHGLAHESLHTDPWVFSSAPNSSLGKPPFMLKLTFWKVPSKCLLMVSTQFSPRTVCFCLCPWRQALGVQLSCCQDSCQCFRKAASSWLTLFLILFIFGGLGSSGSIWCSILVPEVLDHI